ncbi:MAG: hypothetical protein FWC43_10150 [Planctomycetaceae bacterium]|nr:hypothetical protein [Planctomycetaceae bacterium]
MTQKHLQTIFSCLLLILIGYFGFVGIREIADSRRQTAEILQTAVCKLPSDTGWQLKEPSDSAEFIAGPLAASVGELCVFRLSDPGTKADWIIVPPATCYIDSSGSSLAFASNVPAKYTIIAAIVEEGVPKILSHICDYGLSPEPTPGPTPTPNPTPIPQPANLTEWVTKNIPESGRSQAAALASCYEAAAEAIEKNAIRTTEAAFSTLRTATQTKIKPDIWGSFLDQLAVKVTEKLDGSNDVKKLGTIFSEIANGLRLQTSDGRLQNEHSDGESTISTNPDAPIPDVCCLPSATSHPQPILQPRRQK